MHASTRPAGSDRGRVSPARRVPAPADPYRWIALGLVAMFVVTLPAILTIHLLTEPEPPPPAWAMEAAALGVEAQVIALGEATYRSSCALCHGPDGEGVPRLGKPLRNSAFVQRHTDEELLSLIRQGRLPTDPANTTGVAMPPRGGQNLSDAQLAAVVTFLRAIQDPGQPAVSTEDWVMQTSAQAGGEQVVGLVGSEVGVGHDLFVASCAACHGPSGEGIEGLGKPLSGSPFVASKTDEELIAFIKSGRPVWDPENTTGVDMPPKGGNPALSDEQIRHIVRYIRSLHG